MHDYNGELFVPRRTNGEIDILTEKEKNPSQGGAASAAEVVPGRVGRDEYGDARRANITPNGGPDLELGRLRPKRWSRSDYRLLRRHGQHIYTHIGKRDSAAAVCRPPWLLACLQFSRMYDGHHKIILST